MPEIGRPQQRNSFSQVRMAPRQTSGNTNTNANVGERLNRIAGNDVGEQKFVDATQ